MKRKIAGIVGIIGFLLDGFGMNNTMNDISVSLYTGKMPLAAFDKTANEIKIWFVLIGIPCLILGIWGLWGWRKKKKQVKTLGISNKEQYLQ